jgi:hypothetical protein
MRYRLRTLLVAVALGPPVLWAGRLIYTAIAQDIARVVMGGKIEPAHHSEVQTIPGLTWTM